MRNAASPAAASRPDSLLTSIPLPNMASPPTLRPRQIWAPITTPTTPDGPYCTSFQLPSLGRLALNASATITLTQDALFAPDCSDDDSVDLANASIPITDTLRPFYSSTTPQVFILGAMLVIAWSLVIILFITPTRINWYGTGLLDSRNAAILGNGGRPWLQKAATLFVAISICIATVNTFKVLEDQYSDGYEDATAATVLVAGSLELRIFRVLSIAFVLLAQVQTLIRLFPRHREKLIIKWVGIGLVLTDTLFALLNNFYYEAASAGVHPRRATEALPALAYLFEMALAILYAAWVVYYAVEKRRFAFFHPKMRNIFLVAALSLVSVLIPIGFFILDISNPEFVGWGSYVQWVGEAAASVVVWEWVERIEALEWDENKDGILGREIFEGDEMLGRRPFGRDQQPKASSPRPPSSPPSSGGRANEKGPPTTSTHQILLNRFKRKTAAPNDTRPKRSSTQRTTQAAAAAPSSSDPRTDGENRHSPPVLVLSSSPVPRSDDTSAASTVYAIRLHPVSPSVTPERSVQQAPTAAARASPPANSTSTNTKIPTPEAGEITPAGSPMSPTSPRTTARASPSFFRHTPNPFKRRRPSPPDPPLEPSAPEPAAGRASSHSTASSSDRLRIAALSSRFRRGPRRSSAELPVIVVPAQPDGQAWRPSQDGSTRPSRDGSEVAPDRQVEEEGVPSAEERVDAERRGGATRAAEEETPPTARHQAPGTDSAGSSSLSGGSNEDSGLATVSPALPEGTASAYLPTVHESDEGPTRSEADARSERGRDGTASRLDGRVPAPG